MEIFVTGLHITLCFFLILVVLLQPGKGADFGAAMGGSSQEVFGASGGVSLLGKLTALVAGLFMLTSLTLAYFSNAPGDEVLDIDDIERELSAAAGDTEPGATTDPSEGAAPSEDTAPSASAGEAPAASPDSGDAGRTDGEDEAAPETEDEVAPATEDEAEGEPETDPGSEDAAQ